MKTNLLYPLSLFPLYFSNFIIQALQGKDITIYGEGQQTRSFQVCVYVWVWLGVRLDRKEMVSDCRTLPPSLLFSLLFFSTSRT